MLVIESALGRQSIREDISALDDASGGGGAAEAIAISYFAVPTGADQFDVSNVPSEAFLGQAVVINYRPPGASSFSDSYVYEGVLRTPAIRDPTGASKPLMNRYLTSEVDLDCTVKGRIFSISGVYYCQQNAQTHACAHASLRMALTSRDNQAVTAAYINKTLGITPPCGGLKLGQVLMIIHAQGLDANIIDCSGLSPETYSSILAATVESGSKALLVFTTGSSQPNPDEHVVLVFGHTRNLDEWHPQAIPAYAGPNSAPYYPSSNWIDHFLIHDDNFGPYYTLSSQALEFEKNVRAHWIISIRDKATSVDPHGAEASASTVLSLVLPQLAPVEKGRWFEYVTKRSWQYVLRTVLVTREQYQNHLRQLVGHDGTKVSSAQITRTGSLPERFWMVEFSLPALFTGNRAKLGEVIIAADTATPPTSYLDIIHAIRLPRLLLMTDQSTGQLSYELSGLDSHSPVFQTSTHEYQW